MSDTEPPALDLATPAGERSAARLAALRSPGPTGGATVPLPTDLLVPTVPEAVWEDAQRQLAGMLEGLETLQRAVPALGQPSDADAALGAPSVSDEADMGEGTRP